jgi:hypothetical protein
VFLLGSQYRLASRPFSAQHLLRKGILTLKETLPCWHLSKRQREKSGCGEYEALTLSEKRRTNGIPSDRDDNPHYSIRSSPSTALKLIVSILPGLAPLPTLTSFWSISSSSLNDPGSISPTCDPPVSWTSQCGESERERDAPAPTHLPTRRPRPLRRARGSCLSAACPPSLVL